MMSLQQAAAAVSGELRGDEARIFGSVSNDTRHIGADALYVAIRGERFDGHDFVENAQQAGACAALVDHYVEVDLPQIKVADTRIGLGRLARAWRQAFRGKLVAVTGSNGKTTVKEMIAAILAKQGSVVSTHGNLNNDIGMPLTLLRMEQEDFAVIEMGANHPGEIDYLTGIAQPDIAVITNAGPAHLEGFGGLEGVASGKGEIFAGLGKTGTAIINGDDPFYEYWRGLNAGRNIVTFGLDNPDVNISAQWQADDQDGVLVLRDNELVIRASVSGRHNAMNMLAAIAVAKSLDIDNQQIKEALESFQPVAGRLNVYRMSDQCVLIDDTYNANPSSLAAGLEVLCEFPGEHWLVLGDMGELGGLSVELHHQAGVTAKNKNIDRVFTLGELSREASKVFADKGMHFLAEPELSRYLVEHFRAGVCVLVKGSRLMKMENVVHALKQKDKTCS